MADPFVSQVLSVPFTVSPESFDLVTEVRDKALALSWGKTDEEQEKRSFSFCLQDWSTHSLEELLQSHTGIFGKVGNLGSLKLDLHLRIQWCKYTTSWPPSEVVPRTEAAFAVLTFFWEKLKLNIWCILEGIFLELSLSTTVSN